MDDPLFQKTAQAMHLQGQMGYQDRPPTIQAIMRRMYSSESHYRTTSGMFIDHEPAHRGGSLRFVIRDRLEIQTAAHSSHDGSGQPMEETLGRGDQTLIYNPVANVYTVNAHSRRRRTIPLDQIPLSVAIPYSGATVIYGGVRGNVSVLANMLVHPAGLILSSFFSNKTVTVIGHPELSGRSTWELEGKQVPGVPVVPTLGDRWTMWIDQTTGIILRLEYHSGFDLIGWAEIRDLTVNEPAGRLRQLWTMPSTAQEVDLITYMRLARPEP